MTVADATKIILAAGRPIGLVRCTCRGDMPCGGRRYTCPGCLRFVPWCFGAADDLPEFCDDCWGVVIRTQEGRIG